MNQSYPQARTADIVISELPDEVLVYDLKTNKAHCLNQTAARVWRHCDGKNTATDISELLALEANTSVDEAAVWLALERLGKADLLEVRVVPPTGSPRLSRRETVRRLGLGFALSIPVVMSVVAPAAAAAASGCAAPGICRNGAPLIGSAPECEGCATVSGTCYASAPGPNCNNCNASCPAPGTTITTCAGCAGGSWRSA